MYQAHDALHQSPSTLARRQRHQLGKGVDEGEPASVNVETSGSTASSQFRQSSHIQLRRRAHNKEHHSLTVPLWLGCAVLCTILVGVLGFSPFFVTQASNDVIVTSAKVAYTTVAANAGSSMFARLINELIVVILGDSQAVLNQKRMTALNFSDPSWDRQWQLYFLGARMTNPTKHFYYMDLATGNFTGLYPSGAEMFRIIGNVRDVNFTTYRRSATPPYSFDAIGSVMLLFPPAVLFNDFFAMKTVTDLIQPRLDVQGAMMYGFASIIHTPLITPPSVPVGALLELALIDSLVPVNLRTVISRFSGDNVVFDVSGVLSRAPLPSLGAMFTCLLGRLERCVVPSRTPTRLCPSAGIR